MQQRLRLGISVKKNTRPGPRRFLERRKGSFAVVQLNISAPDEMRDETLSAFCAPLTSLSTLWHHS